LQKWFLHAADTSSLSALIRKALIIRLTVLLVMGISCSLIPDHNPGDDVVRFDLRDTDSPSCFCLKGTYCDCGSNCSWESGDGSECLAADDLQSLNVLQRHVYPFLLTPLTRWDAARFLRLAHQPQLYHPRLENCIESSDQTCVDPFSESEMAHVFLPLFPALIQTIYSVLLRLPPWILPATCESVLVMAAWLVNVLSFVAAAISMFYLTERMLSTQGAPSDSSNLWARRVSLLFICNPANIFFGTAYSEALFSSYIFFASLVFTMGYRKMAIVLWTIAVGVRSNGVVYAGFLLLFGLGRALRSGTPLLIRISEFILYGVAACVLFLPLWRHNRLAIAIHCESDGEVRPAWCDMVSSTFNLYAYVQRIYWNVGFLRYYEWKQIPNFLLAAPILTLSSAAAAGWIRQSWITRRDPNNSKWMLIHWAFDALRDFATDNQNKGSDQSSRNAGSILLGGPKMLGHYAVLAATAFLGLTTAHVQISTRMICSTCPALYWYMAVLVSRSQKDRRFILGDILLAYCLLYTVLGVILHPNWLPWT